MRERTETSEDAVSVEGLVKDFRPGFGLVRKRVLHGISFDVKRGEIFGFVGPNGAGKTTTLKLLMGLIHPQEGSARILDHDIRESEFRRHVGFLPENPYFYDYLTGVEFLEFYARVSGVPRGERPARIEQLLADVGLSHAGGERLRNYSKGMLQRIGIAQALIHDPTVVFLDEPMSGLDPIGRKEIRDLILRLNEGGKTIFMNTHILSDVEMLCHRVAIIVKGQIRFEGGPEDFLSAGHGGVDVVLSQMPPQALLDLEEQLELEVRGQGERIEANVAEKSLPDLLRGALAAGAEVVSVTPHRASLETVFLDAVEQGNQDDGSANRAEGGAR
ncbi:MAG: ABC transporter ATP-binding protein [Myxococcota bacterium]|nr:ABC transporter ATP-binding protein [Myxococcota bacterium]